MFEEANRLVNGVRDASQALEGLKSGAESAASGIDDAARAAIAGADALQGIGQAADQAKQALSDVSGAVDLQVDPAPLIETAAAAENAGIEIQGFSSAVQEAKSESGLAADAMSALGFATAEEEESARLCREALDALNGEVNKVADSTEAATGGANKLAAVFGNLGTVAKAAVGSFVGFAALRAVGEIGDLIGRSFRTAAAEFIEAERAATALDAALQSTGKFSSQATSAVRQFADEIARTTTFTDDAVISAAALIAQVGQLGGPKLIQATQAAVELSSVLGRDLQQSALLLARGAAGATEAFSRFGIVVKGAGTDAEKFDQILGQISAKFSGRAAADARTFGGSIEQLKNSWKEFLETVGQSLVVFQPVLSTLTAALQKANKLLGVETVASSIDARAALRDVAKSFDDVIKSQRGLTPVSLQALREGGDVKEVFEQQMKEAVAAAERVANQSQIAIEATVKGGDLDEIADLTMDIARLRRQAEDANDANLLAIARSLETSLGIAKQAKARIELVGADKTLKGLEQIEALVEKLRSLGGASDIEIIDARTAVKNADDFSDASRQIEAGASAVIEAVDKMARAGGKVSGGQLSEGFEALDQARSQILEKFGALAPEIDAAIKEAQDRLQDKARELNVQIELNLIGGFGQEAIDALVASFDQTEAEINAFREFVRSVNAAAGADELTLIQTDKLFAQARSLGDVVPIVEAAMERLRQAVALKAVVGGPAASEGIAALFSAALQGSDELEKKFGELSAEAQASFREIFDALQGLATAFPALQGPVQEFSNQATTVASDVAESFGQAMGALTGNADRSSQRIRQIFATMVKDILKQLSLIEGFSFLGPIGSFLGAVIGAIPKSLPPIEFPPPLVPTPVIPPPQAPKAIAPIEVPVEILPAEIPTPDAPEVEAIRIAVELGDVPEIPDLEGLVVSSTIESPELPTIPAMPEIPGITIPLTFGELTKPDVPGFDQTLIPLAFAEVEAPAVPDVPGVLIPVTLGEVGTPDLPDFGEVLIPFAFSELETPDVPGFPGVIIPIAFEDLETPAVPELGEIEVPLAFARLGLPAIPDVGEAFVPISFANLLAPSLPEFDEQMIHVGFDVEEPRIPELEDMEIAFSFVGPEVPALPEIDLPAIEIAAKILTPELPEIILPELSIPLDFTGPRLPQLPEIEAPEIDIAFARPELPKVEAVPASLEFARRIQLPDSVPASLEFARLTQDRALAAAREARSRRDPLRILEGQRAQPATAITINATDGISVRRQLTAGALRREIERNFRRGI